MERGQEGQQGRLRDRRRRWEKQMLLLGGLVPTGKQEGCNTAMQPSTVVAECTRTETGCKTLYAAPQQPPPTATGGTKACRTTSQQAMPPKTHSTGTGDGWNHRHGMQGTTVQGRWSHHAGWTEGPHRTYRATTTTQDRCRHNRGTDRATTQGGWGHHHTEQMEPPSPHRGGGTMVI